MCVKCDYALSMDCVVLGNGFALVMYVSSEDLNFNQFILRAVKGVEEVINEADIWRIIGFWSDDSWLRLWTSVSNCGSFIRTISSTPSLWWWLDGKNVGVSEALTMKSEHRPQYDLNYFALHPHPQQDNPGHIESPSIQDYVKNTARIMFYKNSYSPRQYLRSLGRSSQHSTSPRGTATLGHTTGLMPKPLI